MRKFSTTLLLALTFLLTLLATTAFTNAPAAHAATMHSRTSKSVHIPNAGGYSLGNFSYGIEYDYIASIAISPHQSGSISLTRSIANSYSGSITLNAQFVSAQVGFSVTQTNSVAISCTFTNNTNSRQYYSADVIMDQTYYDILLGGKKVGHGLALEYGNEVYCF